MTLLDKNLLLSNAQAVTSSAASTDTIDLGAARDIGPGEQLFLDVFVPEGVTASGSATVAISLEADDNDSFSSAVTVFSSGAIGKAALSQGTVLSFPIPRGTERYLRAYYTVATGPLTAGKFTAGISHSTAGDRRSYPAGTPIKAG